MFPTHPRLAPRHNAPLFSPYDFVYTALWNTVHCPVTQVPLGLDAASGLPLGVQVNILCLRWHICCSSDLTPCAWCLDSV